MKTTILCLLAVITLNQNLWAKERKVQKQQARSIPTVRDRALLMFDTEGASNKKIDKKFQPMDHEVKPRGR